MSAIRKVRLVADTCPKPKKGKDCNWCKYGGLIEGGNRIYCYYFDEHKKEESK